MRRVAVCHPSFSHLGGAASVCMNICEALSTDYEVTLISTSEVDLTALNADFNTNVGDVETESVRFPARIMDAVSYVTERTIGTDVPRLREAIFKRYVQRIADDYDYVFSTRNELCVTGTPAAQYIHLPRAGLIYTEGRESLPESEGEVSTGIRLYDSLCSSIERYDRACISGSTLIANSEWTADIVERIYGAEPRIVYPPIDSSAFSPEPWDERENGFVMVGRVCYEKKTLRAIRFVDALREAGYDVHLHVIGPMAESAYVDRVVSAARERTYVEIMGTIPRQRLIQMISTHRYGFHGMDEEHFGMAVAELITGGAVPFVPNGGGQVHIVNEELLIYNTLSEAVNAAKMVLDNEETQRTLHQTLLERSKRYDKRKFHKKIRSIVNSTIGH